MTREELLQAFDKITHSPAGTASEDRVLEGLAGWDSLAAEEFRMLSEEKLGIELDGLAVEKARTVGDLVALVAPKLER